MHFKLIRFVLLITLLCLTSSSVWGSMFLPKGFPAVTSTQKKQLKSLWKAIPEEQKQDVEQVYQTFSKTKKTKRLSDPKILQLWGEKEHVCQYVECVLKIVNRSKHNRTMSKWRRGGGQMPGKGKQSISRDSTLRHRTMTPSPASGAENFPPRVAEFPTTGTPPRTPPRTPRRKGLSSKTAEADQRTPPGGKG